MTNLLAWFKKLPPRVLVAIAFFLALLPSGYFFTRYQQAKSLLQNPQALTNIETNKIKNKVALLMVLPSEEPTLATVSNAKKLKDQPFFKNAENGDKVLIYTNSRKAILYRPSINKIIEVAPININNEAASSSGTIMVKPTP